MLMEKGRSALQVIQNSSTHFFHLPFHPGNQKESDGDTLRLKGGCGNFVFVPKLEHNKQDMAGRVAVIEALVVGDPRANFVDLILTILSLRQCV